MKSANNNKSIIYTFKNKINCFSLQVFLNYINYKYFFHKIKTIKHALI